MLDRKPLTPNNRTVKSLMREFNVSGVSANNFPKSNERTSIFHYARAGRQNSEGFGGGSRITK